MLILSRKKDQRILIDNGIVITVIETRPHMVRIGIEAPPEVRIDREEVRAKRKEDGACTTPSST